VPGSLLFLIEDILLHDLSEISAMLVVLTLLITAITSVSSYRVYTKVFVGRTDFVLPSHLRRDPSRWVGLLILFFILLGLNPWIFLGGH
jgi:hypothetical protein